MSHILMLGAVNIFHILRVNVPRRLRAKAAYVRPVLAIVSR
jgi:hypothetical protein